MNKKLRLLVTGECPRKCKLCCNNRFDLNKIPVITDIFSYDEISITGGEPLLFEEVLEVLIYRIRNFSLYTGKRQTIYLYTSILPYRKKFHYILSMIDGICYTPHDIKSAKEFIEHEEIVRKVSHKQLSLRINIFPEVEDILKEYIKDLPEWKVKHLQWIKNCPVPKDEDFKRINNLWSAIKV
jgi:pyruvate formate-lyase activating enzyme-like uncharacterized protein